VAAWQQTEDMRGASGLMPGSGQPAASQNLLAHRNNLLADEKGDQRRRSERTLRRL